MKGAPPRNIAATPATCGAAKDVPDATEYDTFPLLMQGCKPLQALGMSTPGFKRNALEADCETPSSIRC